MLQRAGEGMGNARISLGGTTFVYAIQVTTADPFSGFPGFSAPPDAYAGRISDSLQLRWGDPSALVPLTCCSALRCRRRNGRLLPRAGAGLCTAHPGQCVRRGHGGLPGEPRSGRGLLAHHHRLGAAGDPGRPRADPADAALPELERSGGRRRVRGGRHLFATPGTAVMPAGGMTFRVNWVSGSPVLEYTNRAPPLATDSWTELSQDVEQMSVVLGVTNLPGGRRRAAHLVPRRGRRCADRRLCWEWAPPAPARCPGGWGRRRSTPPPGTRSCGASARWRSTWWPAPAGARVRAARRTVVALRWT